MTIRSIQKTWMALLCLALLFCVASCDKHQRKKSIPFDQQTWIEGDREVRGQMVDHLINDSLLFGKTKEQVAEMLGGDGDTTLNLSYTVDIGYKTGPFGLGGVWLFELDIHFDSLTKEVVSVRCHD